VVLPSGYSSGSDITISTNAYKHMNVLSNVRKEKYFFDYRERDEGRQGTMALRWCDGENFSGWINMQGTGARTVRRRMRVVRVGEEVEATAIRGMARGVAPLTEVALHMEAASRMGANPPTAVDRRMGANRPTATAHGNEHGCCGGQEKVS